MEENLLSSLEGVKTSVYQTESQILEFTESLLVAFLSGSGVDGDLEDEVTRLTAAVRQLKEIVLDVERKVHLQTSLKEGHSSPLNIKVEVDCEDDVADPLEEANELDFECQSEVDGSSPIESLNKIRKRRKLCKTSKSKRPTRGIRKSIDTDDVYEDVKLFPAADSDQRMLKKNVKISLNRLSDRESNNISSNEEDTHAFSREKRAAAQQAAQKLSRLKSEDTETSSDSDAGLDEDWTSEIETDNLASSVHDNKDSSNGTQTKRKKNRKSRKGQGSKKSTCPKCGMIYFTKEYLINHLKQHEDPNLVPFTCTVCSAQFVREGHLMIHRRSHGECFECPHCKRTYSSLHTMKAHVKDKHTIKFPTAVIEQCPYCLKEKTYENIRHFYDHRRRCIRSFGNPSNPKNGPWSCPKPACAGSSPFSDLNKFKMHMKIGVHPCTPEEMDERINAKKEFFQCPKCTESFESKYFRSHIKNCVCEGQQSKAMPCPICKKEYKTLFTLVDHIKLHQIKETLNSERPFQCPKCSSTFAMERYLKNHLEMFHKTIKAFLCSQCPERFKWKSSFDKHMRNKHSEGPPRERFVCDQCGLSFRENGILGKHKASVHQGIRPYACDLCDKSFKQKSHVDYHRKTHSNPHGRQRSYNKPKVDPSSQALNPSRDSGTNISVTAPVEIASQGPLTFTPNLPSSCNDSGYYC